MSTILVTGATGNIGRHLVGELRRRDVPVRAFVRDAARARELLGDVDRVFLLRASGIPAVILRSAYHMTNVLASAESIRAEGTICTALDDAKIAMIDRRDLAAVAALALTGDGHDGRTYHLTGPEPITYHDVAERISEVLGRTVGYVAVPDQAATDAALRAGAPEWLARGVTEVNRQARRGMSGTATDVVRVLLGREPHDFASFARDVAAAIE